MTEPLVVRYAEADVPTDYGTFRVVVYRERAATGEVPGFVPVEHVAIVNGPVDGAVDVLARVHSECLTGEVLHSRKCDCREQLDLALVQVGRAEAGVVLYLRQEGRGIGLGNKIRAYALQEQGLDTVDANTELGFGADQRSYHVAAAMLEDLGVKSIALMTNNPAKVEALRADGVVVSRRVAHEVAANDVNREYLATKRDRMGHWLVHRGIGGASRYDAE